MTPRLVRTIAGALALSVAATPAWPQGVVQPVQAVPQDQTAPGQPTPIYSQEQLDQMLAPVALYPDQLLGQILMASTYPLEVVQADRWVKDPNNARLKGDQLAAALETIDWDPSVKSLVPFPQILAMMDERLDWTQRLGDAFLAQQADVMNSVQRLRQQALAAGNLRSTPQQIVTPVGQTVVIQPASPEVVYVPVYNPAVVYGVWAYPAYPPIYIPPPPGFYVGPAIFVGISFSIGFGIVHEFWGWDDCDWDHRRIRVDHDHYNVINNYFIVHEDRPRYERDDWEHDTYHRRGVAYRDPVTRQQFRPNTSGSPEAHRDFRGYDHGGAPSAQVNRTNAGPTNGSPNAPGVSAERTKRQPGKEPATSQPNGQRPAQTAQRPPTNQLEQRNVQEQHRATNQPSNVPQTVSRPKAPSTPPLANIQQPRTPTVQQQAAPRIPQTAQRPQTVAQKPPTVMRPTLPPPPRTPAPAFQGSTNNGADARAHAERGRQSLQTMQTHVNTPQKAVAAPRPQRSAPVQRGTPQGGGREQPQQRQQLQKQ